MLERVEVHEAGHAVVAAHFGADVLGIAFALETAGFRAMALYNTPPPSSVDDLSVIYAAGSAGEQLVYGEYGDVGALGDRKDLERVGATLDYPTLVSRAQDILDNRRAHFDRVTTLVTERLHSSQEIRMGLLPNGMEGAFILTASDVRDAGQMSVFCP